jgi:hypothetical protein
LDGYLASPEFDSYFNLSNSSTPFYLHVFILLFLCSHWDLLLAWKSAVEASDKNLTFKLSVAFDISRIEIIPLPDFVIDIRSLDLR